MNNTLNFSRLYKVIRIDGFHYTQRFLKTLILMIIAILFTSWIIGTTQRAAIDSASRLPLVGICFFITILFAPEKLYGESNDSRKGIRFAMLPASALEKTISMVFYCAIVTPLLAGIISLLTDSILSLLPVGAFKGSFIISSPRTLTFFAEILSPEMFLLSFIFIFGTVFFRKRQTIKTIAALIGLGVLSFSILIPLSMSKLIRMAIENNELVLSSDSIYISIRVIECAAICLLLIGSYLRVKKLKY